MGPRESRTPLVVLFEPAVDDHSYAAKFVPLLEKYVDPSLFHVYVVGSPGLKGSLAPRDYEVLELPLGFVGHRGLRRFLLYVISLALSSVQVIRAIRLSRSTVLLSVAGHCYSGLVIAVVGKIMKRKSIVRISEPTRALMRQNGGPGILYALTFWTEKLSLFLCDRIFCVRDMSDYYKLPSRKTLVVSQGVDFGWIANSQRIHRQDNLSPFIVTTARLDPGKNIGKLIDAVDILVRRYPSVGCLVVGWGPEMDDLRQRVITRSLENHVRFTGYVPHSEVPSLLKACDIFVLPSEQEGVPSSILEAMACGLPVVMCLQTGSFAESVKKAHAAITVSSQPEAIAGAVESLSADVQLRESVAKAGFEYVRGSHDLRKSREIMSKLILALSVS